MRSKVLLSVLIILLLFLASSTQARFHTKITEANFPHSNITEEGKIQVIIDEMVQGIKKQKIKIVTRFFSQSFKEGGKVVGREEAKAKLEQFFANSAERMKDPVFVKKTPLAPNITPTWDFEIRDIKVTVDGNTASATCNLIFLLAPPDPHDDRWHRGRRMKETLTFVKEGNFWRLESTERLFDFLENYNQPPSSKSKENEEKSKRKPRKVKFRLK